MSAVTATGCTCGGACAGAGTAASSGALQRPLFFAGQLLTEDDLQALTSYVAAKGRLHNRMLSGAGVVCGLDVVCDPCGNGGIGVRPGYALDCCGHDIVVESAARLDVAALLRDLRHRSLGVDCGDPCATPGADPDDRDYGLYVRYAEVRAEPVAAYPTGDTCGGECQPSRVRETYTYLLKSIDDHDHTTDPAARLERSLGDGERFREIRGRAYRLDLFRPVLRRAAAGGPVEFREEHLVRFRAALPAVQDLLKKIGDQTPAPADARSLAEHVRSLASVVARFDLTDADTRGTFTEVADALETTRPLFAGAAEILRPLVEPGEHVWDDPGLRATVRAVAEEAVARCGTPPAGADQERRMLAAGLPLTAEVRADLRRLREWLLVRLENVPDRSDCALPAEVTPPVPDPASGTGSATPEEVTVLAAAADRLIGALRRLLTDFACRSLLPACHDCPDADVLLAKVTLRDCAVLRVCTTVRPQVHAGPAWSPALHRARELAAKICCPPEAPARDELPDPAPGLAYVEGLLDEPVHAGDLDELLRLIREPQRDELAELRERIAKLEAGR
ncbi:hypothetical protein ACTI_60580 [Actinoplanes sp. OR16]|uniref:hypothetical protein n=1 Tax=Actinoplanes sp. OR16 TaxID=946334 RepID=UPI000F6E3896|nr:hypothetical protein [Actinoplanes sp. OR16]BBH69373.1 hypothetical protein ACTI_60580 [Actinoplanes sp. OR16]